MPFKIPLSIKKYLEHLSAYDKSASGHEEQEQGNCKVLLAISHPFSCKA